MHNNIDVRFRQKGQEGGGAFIVDISDNAYNFF